MGLGFRAWVVSASDTKPHESQPRALQRHEGIFVYISSPPVSCSGTGWAVSGAAWEGCAEEGCSGAGPAAGSVPFGPILDEACE